MRSKRPSRVMPALFTSSVTAPSVAVTSAQAAATLSSLATSSAMPRPATPAAARASLIRCAPASEVAVPTTVAPARPRLSAIARPMPREAPVTSAVSPFKSFIFVIALFGVLFGPQFGERGLEGIRIVHRQGAQSAIDALREPRQHPPRAGLHQHVDPHPLHGSHAFDPSHRAADLL